YLTPPPLHPFPTRRSSDLIIIIGTDDSTIFKLATTLNKPCVLINSIDREMALDSVSPDHRAIGFTAMRHLFEQGHRRILTMTCRSEEHTSELQSREKLVCR